MANDAGVHEVMNLSEAAAYIRVSEKTLREMARGQRIPCQRAGREWRFLRDALRKWLAGEIAALPSPREPPSDSAGSVKVAEPLVQYEIPFAGFRDTAFKGNHDRTMHRWVPWIAGFSAKFVAGVLEKQTCSRAEDVTVLDPFAGVGTTLVEALKKGFNAVGFELNPYAALACKVKVAALSYDVAVLRARIDQFEKCVTRLANSNNARPRRKRPQGFVSRVAFFSPDVERQVLFCCDALDREELPWVRDLLRVALGSVMVGFSNYSYEPSLGTRRAAGRPDVEHADVPGIVVEKLRDMAEDVAHFQEVVPASPLRPKARVYPESYFHCTKRLERASVDVLITSPPYLNNYHYIRNTRPQMFWLGMAESPSDLKEMEKSSFGQFWQTVRAGPPAPLQMDNAEIRGLIELLREQNRDKKPYGGQGWANYACTYFNDCAKFCRVTRKIMKPGGTAVVVIGNNILQGIEFKTDKLFAQIAEDAGFKVVDLHEVRKKRTGTSIVNSSVRAGVVKKRTHLYETAIELSAP